MQYRWTVSAVVPIVVAGIVAAGCSAGVAETESSAAAAVQSSGGESKFNYRQVKEWAPTPPYPSHDWEMSSVALSPDGKYLYATRRSDPPILAINAETGDVIRQVGTGLLVWPHGIHVDAEGLVWVADATVGEAQFVGTHAPLRSALDNGRGHMVLKVAEYAFPLLELGTKGRPGNDEKHFNAPSAVLTTEDAVFVVDGHGHGTNNRIVKFSKDGKFIKTWGKEGTGPGDFRGAHAIAMDSKGRLIVCDRTNKRLQVFDQEGNYITEWKVPDLPHGVAIMPDDTMFVSTFHRVMIGSAATGEFFDTIEDVDAEGVAVDAKGNLYVAEVFRRALRKFVRS